MENKSEAGIREYKPELICASSYGDERGLIYSITGGNHDKLHEWESKLNLNFFHTKIARNRARVFRGFHTDHKSWKKCTCLKGKIKAIIIDPKNETYATYLMNDEQKQILLIPPGWYNGFLSLTSTIYAYCLSYDGNYIDAEEQQTIKPKDSCYGIEKLYNDIENQDLILSDRDS